MPNLIEVTYAQTGKSKSTNELGMREMQSRAYNSRKAQYLLLKAPPASGKSRALMFIALDKLINQGLKKVIVAVPERSIGSSFGSTNLKQYGFYSDWNVNKDYNLCANGSEKSKVKAFKSFLKSKEQILVCTHATLRFAFDGLEESAFDNILLAIDEFHHVSADGGNRLGEVIRLLMENSSAHIVAMTGSYFRGDSIPVLLPEDEEKFTKVTYNYYEQLNGYEFLKSLGIGYHFYQGRYTSAIAEVLDTDQKTILHIPNVNSAESTKDKLKEIDTILDTIGNIEEITDDGIIILKRHSDGKLIKVADLVNDEPKEREKVISYLRNMKSLDDMDLIIALGMAKEGFDWEYCQHALTVGYRSSLTEIIQIIGRATRDSDNKTHAQFTNLIAQPDAHNDEVKLSVNNMLKAITASLLMEQVLAPSFKFKPRFENDNEPNKKGEIKIKGFKLPSSKRVGDIIESDLNDLKATILQDTDMLKAMSGSVDAEVINKILIPKIIRQKYPKLDDEEIESLREFVVVDSVVKNAEIKEDGDKKFIRMADKFINIDELHIDLIDQINPFQKAFEILSKSVTTSVLKLIQESIESTRISMSEEEAVILYPKILTFRQEKNRLPDINSVDVLEKRMAEALIFLKNLKRERMNG
ncbi:MAG TPA: DEAD/DEAH box helicase [Campylobacterales bacterium]|nr:DEAD/DEAH box helicase [Campylobacterales bacterium]